MLRQPPTTSSTLLVWRRRWFILLVIAAAASVASSSTTPSGNFNSMAFRARPWKRHLLRPMMSSLMDSRSGTATAFVSSSSSFAPAWRNPMMKNQGVDMAQQYRRSLFSTLHPGMPLHATIPSTDESLDFGDLDYFNGIGSNVQEEKEEIVTAAAASSMPAAAGGIAYDDESIYDFNGDYDDMNIVSENIIIENNNPNNNKVNAENLNDKEKHQTNEPKIDIQIVDDPPLQPLTIKSQPKPGGKWNPDDPLKWCEGFGSRSRADAERLAALTHLRPGDEGYFDVTSPELVSPGITVVRNAEQARIVMNALMDSIRTEQAEPDERKRTIHACDTEVMDIDLKSVGPVGHGYVTCLSVYSGPDFDYGLGDGPGTMLWVDNLDDAHGILQEFKPWLEHEGALKVWHNYGFDRHVLYNEDILVKGFGGDTMHMARLSDTSRMKYSLESLSEDLLGDRKVPMKEIFGVARLRKDGTPGALVDLPNMEVLQRSPESRKNWIDYACKDAKSTYDLYRYVEGKLADEQWIPGYSLMDYYHMHMRPFAECLTDLERRGVLIATDYLADVEVQARKDRVEHVATFRKWAAERIGPDGMAMNLASSVQLSTFLFGGAENTKTKEATERVRTFKTPRADIPDEAMEAYRERDAMMKEEKENNASWQHQGEGLEDGGELVPEEDEFDQMKAAELKILCKEYGLKVSGKKAELQQRLRGHFQLSGSGSATNDGVVDDYEKMTVKDLKDACAARALSSTGKKAALIKELREDDSFTREIYAEHTKNPSPGEDSSITNRKISELLEEAASAKGNDALKRILDELKAKNAEEPKYVDVKITSLDLVPDKFTVGGAPSATADVLRKLAGDPFADPPNYGKAYKFFGEGQAGHDACVAFFSLTAIGSIDTMIANFLTSLQTLADKEHRRVHGSLNINTETGRLSSRKPNLQNQPALEKDKYKIRQAFIASPGNRLIVADYGQLELRLLASMTNCISMIEAFEAGGDFHSRTALGMFKYIQDAVENEEVLLEWDYANGDPPKPMLKDKYASERRKAKTLNFSIAYGKTAHGLSQDWGVSTTEAEEMLRAWYDSRPEVEKWQKQTKATAKKHGLTRTLMGRYRHLPHAKDKGSSMKALGHALRASINTPIQGGAADVAMMAMLKINNSPLLKKLGWILLMQVHDEVMLEGPAETADEAFEEVLNCMQEPWVLGLEKTKVPLLVDGSCKYDNWYDAK